MKKDNFKYSLPEGEFLFVSEEQLQYHAQLTPSEITDWLLEYTEFIARFQNEEDYRNSLKARGNKYGEFSEHVIQETIKTRQNANS